MFQCVHLQRLDVDELPSVALGHLPGHFVAEGVLGLEAFGLGGVGVLFDDTQLLEDFLLDLPFRPCCWFVEVDRNHGLFARNGNTFRLDDLDLHQNGKRT